MYISGGGPSVGLFLVVACVMYFRPVFNNLTYVRSFIFLLGLILMIPNFFSNRYDIVVFIFFITAFYIILSLTISGSLFFMQKPGDWRTKVFHYT